MPGGGRVAGKVGIYSSHYNGNMDVQFVPLGTYDQICHINIKAIFDVNCKFITVTIDIDASYKNCFGMIVAWLAISGVIL